MKMYFTTRKEMIFMVALFFEVLTMLIGITTIPYMVDTHICNLVLKLLRYIGYLLVCVKILLDGYRRKEIIIIIGIVCILVANSLSVGGNAILCLFLFIIGMKGIDFNKVCKVTVVWYVIAMVLTIGGSQIGIIENWGYSMAGRPRVSLGYFYPSHATSAIFYCICMVCCVIGKKIRIWQVILIELFNLWQYKHTDSRAGTLMMMILPLAFYYIKIIKKDIKDTLIGKIMIFAYPVSALFSVVASYFYNGQGILYKINGIISNRLKLANNAFGEYGISLFGKRIKWVGNGGLGHIYNNLEGEYNYVDCSYVKILLDYGLVFFVLIIIGFTIASLWALRHNQRYILVALSFVAVYSIIEPRLIEIGFNPFVLMLVVLVDRSLGQREENIET